MIPSPEKGEGQIKVTQTSKYSPLWVAEDGREFMRNEFNSFWQINKKAERFQDSGNAFSRTHSSFGGILDYEQKRAINLFDSRDIVSQMSDAFTYEYDMEERVDSYMKETMLEQEEIAKKYLESTQVQARFN